ncbi:MAG TPA: hypothetical protein VNH83_18075 [Bryobacteraceae bacterium]|nr:hypothetical protein [Bryobacteraceae bacterium]
MFVMAVKPRRMLTKERDGARGLVPTGADAHLDTEYARYLDDIGLASDPALKAALASSPDIRFQLFLKYLALPSSAKTKHPLVYCAKRATIDMSEMMAWVSKAHNARALALAQAAAPKINQAMAVDAESRFVACERCDGFGYVSTDPGLPEDTPGYRLLRQDVETGKDIWVRTCPNGCDRGKLREPGNEFARERLLEQSGLINKKGIGLQLVQHFGGQSMPSAVSRLDVMTIDVEPG